jgi:hypothetical protein
MYLPPFPSAPDTAWQLLMNPTSRDPEGHCRSDGEGCWNRSALEVLGLSSGILWQMGHGDVESGETGKTAEDEDCENDLVNVGTDSERESSNCRSHAKRNLGRSVSTGECQ